MFRAAGSFAVMTGGAAVGAAADPAVIVLALLVFLWTPAHFWALAMAYREDYAAAHVPMLPVHASSAATPWWIFVHAASTVLAAVALAVQSNLGWPYLIIAVISSAALLLDSVRLIQMPTVKRAFRLFMPSNLFLSVIVLAIILVTVAHRLISG